MIPLTVERHLAMDGGNIARTDPNSAEEALVNLGVAPGSEFGQFYLKYRGSFISPRPVAELLDIAGPAIPAIPDQTDYVRDRYHIPDQYLALTSDEGEGMYLYDKQDQAVYDLDIVMLEDFIHGRMAARWPTFNEFLVWYFAGTGEQKRSVAHPALMNISDSARNRIDAINWFSNIGGEYHSAETRLVARAEALQLIGEAKWENVTLAAANEISGFLARKYANEFQWWNNLAQQAKSFFHDHLIHKIPAPEGVDKELLMRCIEWDVVHFLIEDAYKENLPHPLFFESLIKVYASGNLPCGWQGEWPDGKLLVW
jgi:hypothetical protein